MSKLSVWKVNRWGDGLNLGCSKRQLSLQGSCVIDKINVSRLVCEASWNFANVYHYMQGNQSSKGYVHRHVYLN